MGPEKSSAIIYQNHTEEVKNFSLLLSLSTSGTAASSSLTQELLFFITFYLFFLTRALSFLYISINEDRLLKQSKYFHIALSHFAYSVATLAYHLPCLSKSVCDAVLWKQTQVYSQLKFVCHTVQGWYLHIIACFSHSLSCHVKWHGPVACNCECLWQLIWEKEIPQLYVEQCLSSCLSYRLCHISPHITSQKNESYRNHWNWSVCKL